MIEFRLSDQYPPDCPEASFSPCDKESAMESIHNYFLDFFGDTVEHQYVENYKEFIPHLPKLSLCILFSPLKPERIGDIENTEHFLASSPVLKHISMSVAAPKLFSPESKFWQAESITLTLYSNTVPTFLRHFQGRQAFVTCYKWQDLDLIAFVNRWKSGKGSRKLETLNLQLISNDIPLNEFLNALGVKRIDESKTPTTHTLPVMFNLLDTVPIISHSYVVRKTDNRVASVLIRNESFSFGVWKETEEEFLRMVK
ncbi:hypothetical protein B9Z55_009680 [Caenorhabditis nigoni]|uniref:F-box associated domain-containing protein n=1 Tax=Caenorhabditis nigoni TaxID=1611254 RepID=A0A2G5UTI5_9PELO|nr:hypothetical protein B9Z55_009680 [Caenorhabditis nigoni]